MEPTQELIVKRSYSECLSSPILSPSPIKRNSKLSSSLAREVFDFSSETTNVLLKPRANTTNNIVTVSTSPSKFDCDSSSLWTSDSNGSSFMKDCESPVASIKNPFYQEYIFEEVTHELPSRTSNPIVRDACFTRNNKISIGTLSRMLATSEPHTSNL